MNCAAIQQNAFAACDTRSPLICPKPRRPVNSLQWQICQLEVDYSDLKAGVEFIDIYLSKVRFDFDLCLILGLCIT